MTILHILKNKADRYPIDLIKKQSAANKISILLIQEARVMEIKEIDVPIFILSSGLKAGHNAIYPTIGYREMLNMIFKAESVMVW